GDGPSPPEKLSPGSRARRPVSGELGCKPVRAPPTTSSFGRSRWVVLPGCCPGEAPPLELQERGAGRLGRDGLSDLGFLHACMRELRCGESCRQAVLR